MKNQTISLVVDYEKVSTIPQRFFYKLKKIIRYYYVYMLELESTRSPWYRAANKKASQSVNNEKNIKLEKNKIK